MQIEIENRIKQLKQSIAEVAKSCARDCGSIQLVAVSKTIESEKISRAFDQGLRCFGENRVQELLDKMPKLPQEIQWHLIGHLQTNKVKQVIGKVALIHSLDRPDLLNEIEKQAKARGIEQVDCLIQVNSSGEASKYGLALDQVQDFAALVSQESPVHIRGLMTIGPLTDDKDLVRNAFRETKALQEKLKTQSPEKEWGILSMGMSGDYRIAIEEGSTMLRVGSSIFGERLKK